MTGYVWQNTKFLMLQCPFAPFVPLISLLHENLDSLKQHGDVIWNIANLLRGPYGALKGSSSGGSA